ncbi:MAG: hypothetical protein BWK77_05265, partial [Verrucomicrobia bacterium A1]
MRPGAAILCVSLAVSAAGAADWPVFRGDPALTGVAAEEVRPPLRRAWSVRVPKGTRSSPVIAAGRVFIGTDSNLLVALDLKDGRTLWSHAAPDSIEAPPLVAGDLVVAGCTDGSLIAVKATDGMRVWIYTTGDKILGSPNLVPLGGGRTLVVAGSYDNKVHAVD